MLDYNLLEKYGREIAILFVEDDENLSKEMALLLKDIFYKVDIAYDGEEAFFKYMSSTNNYDLIITDIQMPNMDGIELIKNIYRINPEQKVVVLSAHSESHYLMELVNVGVFQFVLKPIDYDNFLEVIFNVSRNIYNKRVYKNEKNSVFIKLSDELSWNKQEKQLILNQKVLKLTKKEFLFLDLLMKTPQKIYTNKQITNYLYEEESELDILISNLKNLISRLRKKVPMLDIQNNYGVGYSIRIY